jgi:putative SOS response-associated peptidase YedK
VCNLYTQKKTPAVIADLFSARVSPGMNAGEGEVYPGGRGMVVREDGSQRIVEAMTWGFPMRLKFMKPESKPKPVNNIADVGKYPWKFIAAKPEHRCLIPLTGFCEAEGEKGAKTRTWFGLKDRPVLAWAGMWKQSDEWGAVYSGLMTDCNEIVRPVHNRMPVLLHEEDYDVWLHGSLDDVLAFQGRCFPDELMVMERTSDLWSTRRSGAAAAAPAS